jgi:hypothetical protein
MAVAPSAAQIGSQRFGRWLLVFWLASTLSICGLAWTAWHPDKHPVVFAFCICWWIAIVIAGVSRDAFLRIDPRFIRFARWEREGIFYERLGVAGFGWLLAHSPAGWLNPYLRMSSGRSGLEQLLREINYAEGAHMIGGSLTVAIAAGYWLWGHGSIAASLMGATVLFHVYPIMLQRWNRGRVLLVIRRLENKSLGAASHIA